MNQQISELMDSELDGQRASRAWAAMDADASLQQTWHDYHLIGDALRVNSSLSLDVRELVHQRLAVEPVVLAPRRWLRPGGMRLAGAAALAASISFVAVIGFQQFYGGQHAAVMMGASLPVPADLQHVSANADAYFFAHQELAADQDVLKVVYGQETAH